MNVSRLQPVLYRKPGHAAKLTLVIRHQRCADVPGMRRDEQIVRTNGLALFAQSSLDFSEIRRRARGEIINLEKFEQALQRCLITRAEIPRLDAVSQLREGDCG